MELKRRQRQRGRHNANVLAHLRGADHRQHDAHGDGPRRADEQCDPSGRADRQRRSYRQRRAHGRRVPLIAGRVHRAGRHSLGQLFRLSAQAEEARPGPSANTVRVRLAIV